MFFTLFWMDCVGLKVSYCLSLLWCSNVWYLQHQATLCVVSLVVYAQRGVLSLMDPQTYGRPEFIVVTNKRQDKDPNMQQDTVTLEIDEDEMEIDKI